MNMYNEIYTILSVIVVSLVSIFVALPFLIKKRFSEKFLLFMLSFSVGTLLGAAFLHFLPEIVEEGYTLNSSIYILAGFFVFFVIERLVHWHHAKKNMKKIECSASHSHAYHLAPINLIGDGIHNLLDGVVIAVAYAVSVPLGLVATITIIFHEIPQEMSDFAILLYSGLSKKKAVMFNFFSALTALVGAVVALLLLNTVQQFVPLVMAFALGSFVYIAASSLVPELHKHCEIKQTIMHLFAITFGVVLMIMMKMLFN
jgi:zinc and cadmium transporter